MAGIDSDSTARAANITNRSSGPWQVNPCTLALIATVGGVLLTFFPPAIYEDLLDEPDYMFGDSLTLFFVALCLVAFLIGFRLVGGHKCWFSENVHLWGDGRQNPNARIAVFLAVASCVIAFAVVLQFIGDPSLFFSALATGSADSLRTEQATSDFSPLKLLPLGIPLLVWSTFQTYRSVATVGDVTPRLDRSAKVVLYAVVFYSGCLLLTLQRNLLMPFILAQIIMLSGTKWHTAGVAPRRLFWGLGVASGGIVGLFLLVAYFRAGDSTSPLTLLVGYLPASFNRLSATLHGVLSPEFPNQPLYSLRFFWYPPLVRHVIAVDDLGRQLGFHLPESSMMAWTSEFKQVGLSGLNPSYIWPTVFGYTYFDFGWYGALYFLVLGATAGWGWKQFARRTAWGIILYPYIAASILLWPTDNYLSLPQIWLFVATALLLRRRDRTTTDSVAAT